jgi:hypothetical protein
MTTAFLAEKHVSRKRISIRDSTSENCGFCGEQLGITIAIMPRSGLSATSIVRAVTVDTRPKEYSDAVEVLVGSASMFLILSGQPWL